MSKSLHCERCHKVFTFYGDDEKKLNELVQLEHKYENGLYLNPWTMIKSVVKCCENPFILSKNKY